MGSAKIQAIDALQANVINIAGAALPTTTSQQLAILPPPPVLTNIGANPMAPMMQGGGFTQAASYGAPVPVPTTMSPVQTQMSEAAHAEQLAHAAKQVEKQQEELQKKLLDTDEPQTLQQQEDMSIKGSSARHL